MELQFKDFVKAGIHVFLAALILINLQGCQNKGKDICIKYQFRKDRDHLSASRFFAKLDIHKILLPAKRDSIHIKNNLIPFKNDILPTNILDMFTNDYIRILEAEITKDISERVIDAGDSSANIAIKSNVDKFTLKANGVDIPLGDDLTTMLKIFLEEEHQRKLASNGDWQDLPKILGVDLTQASGNPYINKLLTYLKIGFSYPSGRIEVGHDWNSDLHIIMPIDSISNGQSQGFIKLDVKNKRKLEKIEKDIANIALELSINLSWDVTVSGQGYSKCNLLVVGRGYQFFDLGKGWDYGMFFKGDLSLKIDAETIDEKDKNKKNTIFIDITGKIETANKLK